MSTLSVCIITKNEAHNISACLSSIAWADEIIVLDSQSTDNTVEICKTFTDKVFIQPWLGCGPQREKIFTLATCEWVLFLDADERITPELGHEIQQKIITNSYDGYEIPFRSYYCGKQIRFGDWMHEKHLRLFKRAKTTIIPRLVHFGLEVNGKIGKLKNHILHFSFPNLNSVINKMHAYSSAGAEHFFRKGKKVSFGTAIGHAIFTFMRGYILRFGFLDGRHGFMLAVSNAEGSYYKYLKVLELQNIAHNTSNQPYLSNLNNSKSS